MMLRIRLADGVAQIIAGRPMPEVIFALLEWAEAQGRTEDLIRAAVAANPGNPDLKAFAEQALPDALV